MDHYWKKLLIPALKKRFPDVNNIESIVEASIKDTERLIILCCMCDPNCSLNKFLSKQITSVSKGEVPEGIKYDLSKELDRQIKRLYDYYAMKYLSLLEGQTIKIKRIYNNRKDTKPEIEVKQVFVPYSNSSNAARLQDVISLSQQKQYTELLRRECSDLLCFLERN